MNFFKYKQVTCNLCHCAHMVRWGGSHSCSRWDKVNIIRVDNSGNVTQTM